MPILSSRISRQLDLGAFWLVDEEHTDHLGRIHHWRYTPTKAVDLTAKLSEHAAAVQERAEDEEVLENIERNVLRAEHNTKQELLRKVRELYRSGDPDTVLRCARWLNARMLAGDYTEEQVRLAFGASLARWPELRTKLTRQSNAAAEREGAIGE